MSTTQAMRPARTSRRPSFTTLALVGALHVVVIYGLYQGLTKGFSTLVPHGPIEVIPVATPKPPPPTPVNQSHVTLVKPSGSEIPVPRIDIARDDDGHVINLPPGNPLVSDNPPVIVAAHGIAGTHSTPDYPLIAVRLNQTGNVLLKLTIDERGSVIAASVEKSSGYDSLDNAAVAWVIAHWRYEPATKDGKPFATATDAVVTFRLTGR
jgi:periplasmic protein TonB